MCDISWMPCRVLCKHVNALDHNRESRSHESGRCFGSGHLTRPVYKYFSFQAGCPQLDAASKIPTKPIPPSIAELRRSPDRTTKLRARGLRRV